MDIWLRRIFSVLFLVAGLYLLVFGVAEASGNPLEFKFRGIELRGSRPFVGGAFCALFGWILLPRPKKPPFWRRLLGLGHREGHNSDKQKSIWEKILKLDGYSEVQAGSTYMDLSGARVLISDNFGEPDIDELIGLGLISVFVGCFVGSVIVLGQT